MVSKMTWFISKDTDDFDKIRDAGKKSKINLLMEAAGRKLWKLIKNLTGNEETSMLPSVYNNWDNIVADEQQFADELCQYYADVTPPKNTRMLQD